MNPTPEQIAAFADDQLDGAERSAVEAAIAADPALQQQVADHRALRRRLAAHFAPLGTEPVPDRLAALLATPPATVVDLAEARARRRGLPRWAWVAAPALAASLVLAVMLSPRGKTGDYAGGQLAAALEDQLVEEQSADAPVRMLLSFRDKGGSYCRAFAGEAASGIACRDAAGWKLRAAGEAGARPQTEYRQAGSDAEILQAAQAMASGPALDAGQERKARAEGWLAP